MLAQKGIVYSDVSGSCGGVTACRSAAGGYVREKIFYAPSNLQLSGRLRHFVSLINSVYSIRSSSVNYYYSPLLLNVDRVRPFFPSLNYTAYDYYRLYNIYGLFGGAQIRINTPTLGEFYLNGLQFTAFSLSSGVFNCLVQGTYSSSCVGLCFVRFVSASGAPIGSPSFCFYTVYSGSAPFSFNLYPFIPSAVLSKLYSGCLALVKLVNFGSSISMYPVPYYYSVPVVS